MLDRALLRTNELSNNIDDSTKVENDPTKSVEDEIDLSIRT